MVQTFFLFIAPVPTPPTSVRDTESHGSDHGTTMRVNIPSGLSNKGESLHEDMGSTDTPHVSFIFIIFYIKCLISKFHSYKYFFLHFLTIPSCHMHSIENL